MPGESEKPRLSKDDPVLKTLNKLAEILGDYDRITQLRLMASACSSLGLIEQARAFLDALERETWERGDPKPKGARR